MRRGRGLVPVYRLVTGLLVAWWVGLGALLLHLILADAHANG